MTRVGSGGGGGGERARRRRKDSFFGFFFVFVLFVFGEQQAPALLCRGVREAPVGPAEERGLGTQSVDDREARDLFLILMIFDFGKRGESEEKK